MHIPVFHKVGYMPFGKILLVICCMIIDCPSTRAQNVEKGPAISNHKMEQVSPSYTVVTTSIDTNTTIPIYERLIKMGDVMMNIGENEVAIMHYRMALPYVFLYRAKEWESTIYFNIGRANLALGRDGVAIENFLQSLDRVYCRCISHIHGPIRKNRTYINMIGVYTRIKDYEKAIFYGNKSLETFDATRDTVGYAASLGTMAIIYSQQNKFDSAIFYNRWALKEIARVQPETYSNLSENELQNMKLKKLLLNNLADNYLQKEQPDSAKYFLEKTKSEFHLLPAYPKSGTFNTWGTLFLQQKHLDQSLVAYKNGLAIAEPARYMDMAMDAHEGLARVYALQGNHTKSIYHQGRYNQIKDSMYTMQDIHRINQLELSYLTEQKNREIAETQLLIVKKDAQIRERNSWLYIISIGAIVLSGLFIVSYRNYKHKQLLNEASLLNVQQQQEISNLQAKVAGEEQERSRIARELHDGIVSQLLSIKLHLNTISASHNGLVPVSELEEVTRQVAYAAQDLRQTAHNLMPELLIDLGIAHALSTLCKKTEKHTGMTVHFQTTGTCDRLPEEQELALLRIVQELIQNVLKHADATQLIVQLSCRKDMLSITVEDNGKGLPAATGDETVPYGLGLKNVMERVNLLKGYFDIKSRPGKGTTAYMEMEINEGVNTIV